MSDVRVGIIGFGTMGREHGRYLSDGTIKGAELAAVCDTRSEALGQAKEICGKNVQTFDSVEALFAAKCVDAVMIAMPHYQHPPLSIQAFEHGLHVLTEKPVGVYTKHVRRMNEAAEESGKIFAAMFQQRTWAIYKKLKDLLEAGELGEVKRNCWIATDWYRPQSYFDSGGWRASWAGEGGGVLLNQCPHNLDMWQWLCGMPKRVRGYCAFGKYHDIEVEDDVTAYVEYENGATGVFIASTGEAPGTDRLEIVGDCGKIVMEDGKLTFWRNRIPERRFNKEYQGGFGAPECWKCEIPVAAADEGGAHYRVTQKWIDAIRKGDSSLLVADGREGIRSLELSNAMLLSEWTGDWVELPIDGDLYYSMLEEKIKTSTCKKDTSAAKVLDVQDSF